MKAMHPRTRVKLRRWANLAAVGTAVGFLAYVALLWAWPSLFQRWFLIAVAVSTLVANAAAAWFYGQAVRARRAEQRRAAAGRAAARAAEWLERTNRKSRDVLEQDTVVLKIVNRVVDRTTYVPYVPRDADPVEEFAEDKMRQRLWRDLTERTGDIRNRKAGAA